MTPERFATLVDAYGADPKRWPDAERDAALAYLAATPAARALVDEAMKLDRMLDRLALPAVQPDVARIAALATAARQDAANVVPFRKKAATARPAWQWARAAALAAAGICGLIVGMENAGDQATRNTGTAVELYDAAAQDDVTW